MIRAKVYALCTVSSERADELAVFRPNKPHTRIRIHRRRHYHNRVCAVLETVLKDANVTAQKAAKPPRRNLQTQREKRSKY